MSLSFDDLKRHIDSLSDKVADIESHVQTLLEIQNCYNDEKRAGVIQGFNSFFTNVRLSFRRTAIIEICTLINERSDRGIFKLLSRLECFFKSERILEKIEMVNQFKIDFAEVLREQDSFVIKIKEQRDTFWSHSDKKYFDNPNKLFNDFPVSVDELVVFSALLMKLLSQINSQILDKSLDMRDYWKDDVTRIIDSVNDAYNLNIQLSEYAHGKI